ncbi:MAG: glycosyltransferase family 2 protein [Fibrobacteres bacterium]|nr:glycosyltransferase family 2 protein [Fibrobacterota bacterium]
MNTLVLIPAYNAAEPLKVLLPEVVKQCPVLVVDDGSKDNTRKTAIDSGVECVTHEVNRGKGEALLTGFRWASEKGFTHVITIDADGQHSPIDLPAMLLSESDLTIGYREFKFGTMPLARIVSNTLTSLICSFAIGKRVRDSQSGYRKVKLSTLEGFKPHFKGFQFETELLLHAAGKKKCSIGHVPIKTIYNGGVSHIRHFYDTTAFIRAILRYLWTTK